MPSFRQPLSRWVACGAGGIAIGVAVTDAAHATEFGLTRRKLDQSNLLLLQQVENEPAAADPNIASTPAPAPSLPNSFTLGVAYSHDDHGGHSLITPFLLDHQARRWYLAISGDGYTRSLSNGERSSGLADIAVLASYKVVMGGSFVLEPSFEVVLPTHGQVGARLASQDAGLSLAYKLRRWSWNLVGTLFHDNERHPGQSQYMKQIEGSGKYSWSDDSAVAVSAKRSASSGEPGHTKWGAEYQFPLAPRIDGALIFGRSLGADHRRTSIEFDITRAF